MNNRVRIQKWEYEYLKKRLKKAIRIRYTTERFKEAKKIMNRFAELHMCEISEGIGVYSYNCLVNNFMIGMIWGDSYLRRRRDFMKFLKILTEKVIKVIEFEEVA